MDPILTLAAALAAYPLAVSAVVRWPRIALIGISVFALIEYDVPVLPPLVDALGFQVTALDAFSVVLLTSCLFRRQRPQRLPRAAPFPLYGVLLWLFVGLSALALARGIYLSGAAPAVNEYRAWFHMISAVIWTATAFRRGVLALRAAETWALFSAVFLTAVSLWHIAVAGLGSASSALRAADGTLIEAGRPMTSGQAILIALGMIVALARYLRGNRRHFGLLAVIFAVMVLLGQHRSVWIAAVAGVIATCIFRPGRGIALATKALPIVVVAVAGLAVYGVMDGLLHSLETSATDTRTYEGRVFDWLTLVDRNVQAGPLTLLAGDPYGAGWTRARADGLIIDYPPHNWYVSTGLRVGVTGLALMVCVFLGALRGSWRARLDPPAFPLLVAIAVYAWAYNVNWFLAPVLALAIALTLGAGTAAPIEAAEDRRRVH